jgi:hypothetical protein
MEILVPAIVIVAAFFLVVARKSGFPKKFGVAPPSLPPKKRTQPARRSPYRSTSIACPDGGCSAVNALQNVRFLDIDRTIPSIPVQGCNATSCNCIRIYHADRRAAQDDRRPPLSLISDLYERTGHVNRRQKSRGRRNGDWA